MGNRPSVETIQLPQDPYYIKHCRLQPQPFNGTLHIDLATLKGQWVVHSNNNGGQALRSASVSPDEAAGSKPELESDSKPHERSDPALYSHVISTVHHKHHAAPRVRIVEPSEAAADDKAKEDEGTTPRLAVHSAPLLRRNSESNITLVEKVDFGHDDGDHKLLEDSLMLAAAASCGPIVTHILDGYSWGLVTRISTDQHRHTYISVALAPVPDDAELQERETRRGKELKFGMFTRGNISPLSYLFCCGRTAELATTGQVIERRTAHQPIFFPPINQAYFAASGSWPAFDVTWNAQNADSLDAKFQPDSWVPRAWLNDKLGKYDYERNMLLTYTFKHATTTRKTNMKFYEVDGSGEGVDGRELPGAQPTAKGYTLYDRVALHMFGFTKRYFVVYANSLQLKARTATSCSGTCSLTCGTPIMRALNPDFCGDLIIHFVPRESWKRTEKGKTEKLEPFIINTKCQGNVYHTINCFDEEYDGNWTGRVVVDAFVSKLNAQRESAQFELDEDELVYDNEGEPFRFVAESPALTTKGGSRCRFEPIASDVDSTIDFHCINPKFNGLRHCYSYMVNHTRHRDDTGAIKWVESKLIKIKVEYAGIDPLEYDPTRTRQATVSSKSWQEPGLVLSCYLRTPLFVARRDAITEDDGHLFSWSFDSEPNSNSENGLRAYILMFDAKSESLDVVMRVPMPGGTIVPYTVHSSIYSRPQKTEEKEKEWETTALDLTANTNKKKKNSSK